MGPPHSENYGALSLCLTELGAAGDYRDLTLRQSHPQPAF